MATQKQVREFSSKDVKSLQFPDNVRAKPGMYIGATDASGVFTILREAADNVVDEALAGRASTCNIFIDGEDLYVWDDAQGIPRGLTEYKDPVTGKKHNVPTLKAICALTHTSGKFEGDAYEISRGCFVGSTKVELVDGRTVTMKDLYVEHQQGVENYVWSACRKTGELRAQPIENVQLTKRTRSLVEITLDTGAKFICTPDHPLFTTGLKKIEASRSLGASLLAAPFKKDRDGYRIGGVRGTGTYRLNRTVADYYGQDIEKKHVHHIDGNILNNQPDNLKALSPKEHYEEHPEKLEMWMGYLERSGADKSKMLSESNTKASFIRRQKQGKMLIMACRILHEGEVLTPESWAKWYYHGTSDFSRISEVCGSVEILRRAAAKRLARYHKYLDNDLEKGKLFFQRLLYVPGISTASIAYNQSVEMAAKRVIGKAVTHLACMPTEDFSLLELNACFKPGRVSPRALCQYIDLEEFVLAVKGGVNPVSFMYKDLSDDACATRKLKFDKELATLKSGSWQNASVQRLAADFLRKLNAMQADGTPLTRVEFHKRYKNALGNSSWFVGLAALKRKGVTKKTLQAEVSNANHKVVSVRQVNLTEAVPVFDLTVPVDHNYRLACDVFVGNSHGIGIKATNALSSEFEVRSFYKGKWQAVVYNRGIEKGFKEEGAKAPTNPVTGKLLTKGTYLHFKPDPKIFSDVKVQLKDLVEWSSIAAYFTPDLTVNLYVMSGTDLKERTFHFPEGPKAYLANRVAKLECNLIKPTAFLVQEPLVDCIVQFTDYDGCDIAGFTNGLRNADGGVHVNSFFAALKDALEPFRKPKQTFTVHELKDGLVGLVNAKLSHPTFSSQSKEKLIDSRAEAPLEALLKKALDALFKANKALAEALCDRAQQLRALKNDFLNSKKAQQALKGAAKKGFSPNAVIAQDATPDQRELYLLEGESAAGGVPQARSWWQEVLPLKGKPPNALKQKEVKMLENEQVINILAHLGFDPSKPDPYAHLRIKRIIVLADPDTDGPLDGDTLVPVRLDGQEEWNSVTLRELATSETYRNTRWYVRSWNGHSMVEGLAHSSRVNDVSNMEIEIRTDTGAVLRSNAGHNWPTLRKKYDTRYTQTLGNGLFCLRASDVKTGDVLAHLNEYGELVEAIVTKTKRSTLRESKSYYCLTVEGYHCFFLENGILSKNCHIASLVLTLLYKYLPDLFSRGMVYVADLPPFYAIKGEQILYASSAEEVEARVAEKGWNVPAKYIKGWGEIDPSTFRKMAFDPTTRQIKKINPSSTKDAATFVSIMGEGAEARRVLLGI